MVTHNEMVCYSFHGKLQGKSQVGHGQSTQRLKIIREIKIDLRWWLALKVTHIF